MATNYIEKEDELLSAIERKLRRELGYNAETTAGKRFTLWVANNNYFATVEKAAFKDDLIRKLADEGLGATVWEIKIGQQPPQDYSDTHSFEKMEGVFLTIQATGAANPVARLAKITALQGKGSLLQETYLLDSVERQRYNIGVGVLPSMSNNRFRENHIAIDDNIDSPQYDNNKYVSRAHACIVFSEKSGFCLQVEQGGNRLYGSRTRIFRNEETIEVENLQIPVPLHNGDLIELGKAVVLRFEPV